MKRVLRAAAALTVAAAPWTTPLQAQESSATAEKASGREHVVRKGDTLWDLARLYMSDPFRWSLIYEANRGTVENPNLIYPDERLVIPPGVAADAVATPAVAAAAADATADATVAEDEAAARPAISRTRFYQGTPRAASASEPGSVFLRGEAVERRAVEPGEFYAAPWLARRRDLTVLAQVIRIVDREGNDRLTQSIHPFDRVYLRHTGSARPSVDDRLLLVREGRDLDPVGRVIAPAAIGRVEAVDDEALTVVVVEQFGQLTAGDLALPLESFPGASAAAPEPVEDGPVATLLGFVDEEPLYDLAVRGFIDVGRAHGVSIGDELEAFLPERESGGGYGDRVPAEPVARLKVIRVDERSATVRVLSLRHSTLDAGMPVRLVARMP